MRKVGLAALLVASFWTGDSSAKETSWIGVGADFLMDQSDAATDAEPVFGGGYGLRAPVRIGLSPNVWLRANLELMAASGQDRVEWSEDTVRFFSDEHWTFFSGAGLSVGPELGIGKSDKWRPYWGASMGATLLQTWHSFDTKSAVLLASDENDPNNPNNIDPWTQQWVPRAGVYGGLTLLSIGNLALDAEAGYTISFVGEQDLRKTPDHLEAVRASFGLNVIRAGLAVSMPLGKEVKQ